MAENPATKQELEFSIGFEDQDDCDKVNHLMDEDKKFIPYEEQVMKMCHDLIDAVDAVGKAGGSFLYDGVKVKITVEYEEENK